MYPFLSTTTTTTTGNQHMFLILPGESVNNLDPRRSREVPSQMWMQMGSKRVRKKRDTRHLSSRLSFRKRRLSIGCR